MTEFLPVAKVGELSDPGKVTLEVDDEIVVLFLVDGEYFCIDDVCTHDNGPLGEGTLDDHAIACPRHGAKFDIRTGAALTMPATRATRSHEVKVEGETIFVKLAQP
ncbi:MAG: non-heme iron oxygenase ferredoxin subunit [Pirellulales bacterium]